MKSIYTYFVFAVLFLSAVIVDAQFYTGSNQPFGQNRVQYNSFAWQRYNFQEFEIYFTVSGKSTAIYTAKSAHKFKQVIERKLDIDLTDKLQIIVYNSLTEFRQSNIGLTNNENTNIGGVTQLSDNKLFVYFDGSHEHLDEQIKKGLSEVAFNKIIYGNNWREAIKSSTTVSMPAWFKPGLLAYLKQDWNTDIDNRVKDAVMSGKFKNLNWLEGEDAELAGVALWNYISSVYGEKMIPNIIYLTRVSKNVESGFLFSIGATIDNVVAGVIHYYRSRYIEDDMSKQAITLEEVPVKTKKRYTKYTQFKVSPDGKYASYVTYELGQYRVWIKDLTRGKTRKIGQGSYRLDRIPDYSFPVTVWHPSSTTFVYSEERKGKLVLNLYDVASKKTDTRTILRLQKILSMNYSPDGKKMIFSAVSKGQTDIYLYNPIGNSQKQLTHDFYDDFQPNFVNNGTQIIFASTRPDDTLRKEKKPKIEFQNATTDLFVLDIEHPKLRLQRITKTPFANESYPAEYSKGNYTYLSDETGIRNRYRAYYDSTISSIDTSIHYRYFSVSEQLTNFDRNILEFSTIKSRENYTYLILKDGEYHFYTSSFSKDSAVEPDDVKYTKFMKSVLLKNDAYEENITPTESEDDEEQKKGEIDINNYQFEEDVQKKDVETETIEVVFSEDTQPIKTVKNTGKEEQKDSIDFKLPRQELYETNFTINQMVAQIDNAFLTPTYQRYDGEGYRNSGFNELIKVGASDLFEDYRLIGGFKLPVNLNNTEYLLVFEDLKSRLDKKYLLSRRTFKQVGQNYVEKKQTLLFKYALKYPINEVASLRLTSNLRYDRDVLLSTEQATLTYPTQHDYFGGLKMEYIYDNARKKGLNILDGTRLKLWGEFYHQLDKEKTDFFVLGADVRHYQKIHRSFYWASRIATSTSFGHQKLLYYMGGVDNWLFAKFDNSVVPSATQGYQFQTIATPMRGFFQNTRNGNSFAVINNELRLPIFKYFSKKPIKSDFLENFMIIGFGDVGTAWTGSNPYDTKNSFNTTIVKGANYEIILKNQKEPIVYGYGGGLRSRIFGYYVRFDIAWGVDDHILLKPVKYLSLSLDF